MIDYRQELDWYLGVYRYQCLVPFAQTSRKQGITCSSPVSTPMMSGLMSSPNATLLRRCLLTGRSYYPGSERHNQGGFFCSGNSPPKWSSFTFGNRETTWSITTLPCHLLMYSEPLTGRWRTLSPLRGQTSSSVHLWLCGCDKCLSYPELWMSMTHLVFFFLFAMMC